MNIIDLIDLPNNTKICVQKIIYKEYTILLFEDYLCININTYYRFINNTKLHKFYIIKNNIFIKNKERVKIIESNLQYKPLRIESGKVNSFI